MPFVRPEAICSVSGLRPTRKRKNRQQRDRQSMSIPETTEVRLHTSGLIMQRLCLPFVGPEANCSVSWSQTDDKEEEEEEEEVEERQTARDGRGTKDQKL